MDYWKHCVITVFGARPLSYRRWMDVCMDGWGTDGMDACRNGWVDALIVWAVNKAAVIISRTSVVVSMFTTGTTRIAEFL